jgi:glutamate dehydrogenase (NAD(P)+)
MIDEIETLTGMRMPDDHRERLIKGPSEEELVIAALEATMIRAYQQIHDVWKKRNLPDLRTAAFLHAIERIADSYKHHGIFP